MLMLRILHTFRGIFSIVLRVFINYNTSDMKKQLKGDHLFWDDDRVCVKMVRHGVVNRSNEGEQDIYESSDYERSQKANIATCTFEYFISILLTDAFLAKLLTYIGISDAVIGIISSLVSFAFLFQLLSILLMAHLKNVKRTVILFDTLSQVFFFSVYLVPLLPFSVTIKTVIVIACILLAYICKYTISALRFKWANSYVDPVKRGEYSAVKEMVSLVGGILFTLGAGYVIDQFENLNNLQGGFLFLAAAMLILNICNFISLCLIKNERSVEKRAESKSVKEVLRNTLGNKSFVYMIVLVCLYDIGRYMSVGFMGTFKTSDLHLGVGLIQVINMVANFARLLVSKSFGRFSDKTSFVNGFSLGLSLLACAYVFIVFCTPDTWWCIIIYTILNNISKAGIVQNNSNMTYSYVKSEYIVQAMAIKQSIAGVLGFVASLIGSRILSAVQTAGNSVFGIPMYGQQLLSIISILFIVGAIAFAKLVVEKQNRLVQ